MLYFLCLAVTLMLLQDASSSIQFLIQHKKSEKFVHPHNSDVTIPNNDELVIHSGTNDHIHYTFEIVKNEWGYIRHVGSGKNFHPKGGSSEPHDTTKVVLHSDEETWAYFAIDQVNDHIVHYGGKFIHPKDGEASPHDNKPIVIHHEIHDKMKFQLVNISNHNEVVYPYGDAKILGDWKLVYSVENASVTHSRTIKYFLGKSVSESITGTIEFMWESSASAQTYFAKMSTSASLSEEIQQSSSETWQIGVEVEDEIIVEAGKTFATWQKIFTGSQLGHTAIHHSDMFADTDGPHIKPGNYVNIRRFI